MKWKPSDYRYPFQHWTPPELLYPCESSEKAALHALKSAFQPLPPYASQENQAREQNTLVTLDIPLPDGHIAFLENTAEQCISPQTKHSQAGMQGAKHWVQRVNTLENAFRRLTDGYGISLMFGERCHQYIRNSNNWRGNFGCMLDLDVWYEQPETIQKKLEADDRDADFIAKRLAENEKLPKPVFSMQELFDHYPLLPRICSFILPSANSLYEGRPFKARGIVLFPKPVTDQRVYRAIGDILLSEIDCIPANVTKNPVAVGFGNTHNAPDAVFNDENDSEWIYQALQQAESTVLSTAKQRKLERKKKAKRAEHYRKNGGGEGENINDFISKCNPVSEMVRAGLLTPGRGNEYRWHESKSETDRSCEIFGDGVIHIYAHSMSAASPAAELEPVNAHRFYLYQLSGLDMTHDADKPRIREFLFDRGYGSDPKEFAKQNGSKTKLQRSSEALSKPTETLDENRANRETATDTFLEVDTELLHVMLVKDSTGTGKTHTLIGKAQQHKKRTLAGLPHTELARQAVDIAWEHGYKNPFHLVGREHNWNDSGIKKIPVHFRTADLFSRNNCIMFDEVKKYTDKRLAPRTYCEHQCEFRDGCLHLAQYEGLGKRDFIASCTPNLLFDLNMRGYLQSLVTPTDAPRDEDLAIDAMMGTESEPTDAFDFAIVDDYGVNGLYTDLTFRQSEFKALKKAWRGTPTANFAKQILKAFEKKKPQKIVKALRSAFESTREHHTEIAKALTQHARNGIVERAERPKGSKETKRLLSEKQVKYDDGGTQFIPVDFQAYQELKEKGIPTIHPQHLQGIEIVGEQVRVPHTPTHALMAGVPLDKLTPLWQSGATPIQQLQIFLASIGNDKNAPINRKFRAGDPPDPTLTFSIPPQAPVGILPHIAMLSATTPPADTKKAFQGQAVKFSEHIGGVLEWADGVQVYQFTDARLTSASVFEYPTDADGKRILQEAPIGLTPTAENRLEKMNDWAKATEGLTAFISYKEFTEAPFSETVNGFDIVTHFDKVAGMNFDGLKFLVVFGYPKVKHEVVMEQARKQYASDTEPLPKGSYEELTEEITITENGITITERRYKDPRLEKIRHQLATEKIEQAMGRARLPVWIDTETLIFTNAPVGSITERGNLFSDAAFNLAEKPSKLSEAMDRIARAEETGDVEAVKRTKGVSERTAYRQTVTSRKQSKTERDAEIVRLHREGMKQADIVSYISKHWGKLNQGTVSRVIRKNMQN